MESAKNQENSKIDWTKKGRGWIPDYPDIRDYKLDHLDIQQKGRLKTDGTTEAMDNLLSIVEELFKSMQPKKFMGGSEGYIGPESEEPKEQEIKKLKEEEENRKKQEEKIERLKEANLKKRFSGGIRIRKLNIYKILRELPGEKNEYPQNTSSEYLFSKSVSEAKSYLNFLVLKGYMDPFSIDKEKRTKPYIEKFDRLENSHCTFEDPFKNLTWLSSNKFDEITSQLIMLFQICSGITADGILGVHTYETLKRYRDDSNLRENLREKLKCYVSNGSLEKLETSFQEVPRVRVFQDYLTSKVFKVISDKLIQIASEQIYQEFTSIAFNRGEKITESWLIASLSEEIYQEPEDPNLKVKINSARESFKQYFNDRLSMNSLTNGNSQENGDINLENLIKDFLGIDNFQSSLDHGNEFFHNSLYVLDPIVSVIFKIISPLANYKNSSKKEIIDSGFQQFEDILFSCSQNSKNAFINTNLKLEDIEDLKWKAQCSIRKGLQNYFLGIKSIIGKNSEVSTNTEVTANDKKTVFMKTLLFHILIKKFFNKLNALDEIKIDEEFIDEADFLNKQEYFSIQSKDSEDAKTAEDDLFQSGKLAIPLRDEFISFLARGEEQTLYFSLPGFIDLSSWFPKIRDQGTLNSCTAFAGAALYEYFVNRYLGRYVDTSPLFLYKVSRQLMQIKDDGGASVRDTMKAMALFGIPPENSWPYQTDNPDEEPPPFCYAYAQNYQALKYFRLDYAGIPKDILLLQIKLMLAVGFPCMFGFTLYSSAFDSLVSETGYIPFPNTDQDKVEDGHAVVAVGYDDHKFIRSANPEDFTEGAILIRNSWGDAWGNQGYGWLPYDYILGGLTSAWWSLLKAEWFEGDDFGLGGKGGTNSGGGTDQRGAPKPKPKPKPKKK